MTNCWVGGGELGCGKQRRSTCQLWAVSFLTPWLGPAPLFLTQQPNHGAPKPMRLSQHGWATGVGTAVFTVITAQMPLNNVTAVFLAISPMNTDFQPF